MYLGAKVLQLYSKDVLTKGFMVRACCILVRQLLKGKFSVWARHGSKEKFRRKLASEIQSPSWLVLSLNSLQFQALHFFLPLSSRKTEFCAMSCNNTSRSFRFPMSCSRAECRRACPGQPQVGLFTPSQDRACFSAFYIQYSLVKSYPKSKTSWAFGVWKWREQQFRVASHPLRQKTSPGSSCFAGIQLIPCSFLRDGVLPWKTGIKLQPGTGVAEASQ